jgi:mono/diheme cytochrome c family protein
LPLGFTVDEGASEINTALPVEAAAHSNVYPVPLLLPTNNRLNVSLSSLNGFTTGNFLKIRCTVGSATLLATGAQDFSVSSVKLFSDIYKNHSLKDLSIVPVALVYPVQEGKAEYGSLCASCHNLNASDTTTASLYGKAAKLSALSATQHHGVGLSATQIEYLSEYLSTITSGRIVY